MYSFLNRRLLRIDSYECLPTNTQCINYYSLSRAVDVRMIGTGECIAVFLERKTLIFHVIDYGPDLVIFQ